MTRQERLAVVFGGCVLLSIAANAFVIAPSSVAPLFAERFGVSEAAVGNLVSAPLLGMVLTQLPGGVLLDRFDNRWLLTGCVVLFALVVVGMQFVEAYGVLLVARVGAGVLTGLLFAGATNVVGEVFPPDRVGFATGVFITGAPVAFVLAHATGPLLGPVTGPVGLFGLHAAIAAAGIALVWVGAPGPIRSAGTPTASEVIRALGNRGVLLTAASGFATYAVYLFLNTWMPTYGTDVVALDLSTAGVVTALVPLAGIPARIFGGWVSNAIGYRRRPVLAAGLVGGVGLLVAIGVVRGVLAFVVLLAAGGFALQLGTGVYFVLVRELANPGTEGTSLTVMTTVTSAGSLLAPLIGGWVIATASWAHAFGLFAVVGLLGVVVLVPVPEPR